MKNKIILFLVCLIIVIFLIDITKETFSNSLGESARNRVMGNYSVEHETIDSTTIKSIVSKIDGTVLNISFTSSGEKIPSPADIRIHTNNSGNYLGINSESNELIEDNSSNYVWKLHKFINNTQVDNTIKDLNNGNSRGKNAVCIDPPFYMITGTGSNHKHLALQYNYGRVMTAKIGNYDKQAWDVSDKKLDTHQLVVKNIYQTPVGPLTPGESIVDPNKIKINLSVLDDSLKSMLGIENVSSNNSNSNSDQQCDQYLSKEVVQSLCPGCPGI